MSRLPFTDDPPDEPRRLGEVLDGATDRLARRHQARARAEALVDDLDLVEGLCNLAVAKQDGDRAEMRRLLRELRRRYGWSIMFVAPAGRREG